MSDDKESLDELAREVQQLVRNNRQFLDRVMDDDFEPEDEDGVDEPEVMEEL